MKTNEEDINKKIKKEFVESWNSMISFFEFIFKNKAFQTEILNLIEEMRVKGFDEKLRAGQSMTYLILSRSRRHGLRTGQKSIIFNFEVFDDKMQITSNLDKKDLLSNIEYSSDLEELLNELVKEEIN